MSMTQGSTGIFGAIPARTIYLPTRAERAHAVDTFVVNTLTVSLIAAALLQKWALPLGGQLAMVVVTHMITITVLLRAGKAVISTFRMFMFLLTFVSAIILNMIGPTYVVGSYLLFFVTGLMLLVVIPTNMETYLAFMRRFQIVGLAVVGLVFFDHAMQVFGPGMPNQEVIIPTSLLYTNYVYIQPLYWSSIYSKPNAFFFLEASVTSQFLAFCVIIELALFRRLPYIIALGAGIMAVFAGTGFVLILAVSPFLVKDYVKPRFIIIGIVLLAIAAGVAFATGWFDIMLMRTTEFDKTGSSGHARFIAPFTTVVDKLLNGSPSSLFFGDGAGMQDKATDLMLIPMTKVILEYGVFVLVCYMIYTLTAIFGSGVPFICCWAVFIFFHILNGTSSYPLADAFSYFVAAGFRINQEPARDRSVTLEGYAPRAVPALVFSGRSAR